MAITSGSIVYNFQYFWCCSTIEMDCAIDVSCMDSIFIWILACWRSLSTAECFAWCFHHWTGIFKPSSVESWNDIYINLCMKSIGCVSNRRDWRDSDGCSIWLWCGQLSIHQHDLLHPAGVTTRCIDPRATSDADDGHDIGKKETNCHLSQRK